MKDFGDLTKVEGNREAFKEHYIKSYPDSKKGQVSVGVGMLFRFLYEVQIGDYVVFPSKIDRMINIGTIESDYYYEEADGEYVQRRKAKWLKHISRTVFSQRSIGTSAQISFGGRKSRESVHCGTTCKI